MKLNRTMLLIFAVVLALTVLLCVTVVQEQCSKRFSDQPWHSGRLYTTEKSIVDLLPNFHFVDGQIFRSSQPNRLALTRLKKDYGLRTILNLRTSPDVIESENNLATELGLRVVNVPMDATQFQDIETIQKALDVLTDPDQLPVLVHCHAGKDRTGMVIAAYRRLFQHWSEEEAHQEWLAYGFSEDLFKALQTSLNTFVENNQSKLQ